MLTKSEILKFNYHQVMKQLTLWSVLKLLRFEDVKNSLSAAPSEVSCFLSVVAEVSLSALKLSGSYRPEGKEQAMH